MFQRMAKYEYSKYKIIIDPESKKVQGLRVGDVVRRQYFDKPNLIYSLMLVLEVGTYNINGKDPILLCAHYLKVMSLRQANSSFWKNNEYAL